MRSKNTLKVGVAGLGLIALSLGLVSPASADAGAQPADVVGVGSDTVQYGADFLMDGDASGNLGYNAAGNINRSISLDATADSNGRTAYAQGSTVAVPVPLNPTFVLRAGQKPITRINGSGAGITAILADTGATESIQFVRSSRLPKASEQTAAGTAGFGSLHVYQFATDPLQMAVNSASTNAPAGLSIAEIVNIYKGTYTTWGDIPGYAGPAPAAVIRPLIPQTGSGTRGSFEADLKAANGGVTVVYGPNVATVEENDFTAITTNPNAVNVISPFSIGRINLNNGGYFGAAAQNKINALTAVAPDASASYLDVRGLYFIVRDTDVNSTTVWQPGGLKNWAKTLFSGGAASWIGKAANASLITSAGLTPAYSDLGAASAG